MRPIFGYDSSLGSLDGRTRDRALDMLRDAGSTWTRVGAFWPWADRDVRGPEEVSKRDWSVVDDYMWDARRHDQRIIGAVVGYARWASGNEDPWYVPKDPAPFAEFTVATVARYKGYTRSWEIWNEPNGSFWKPKPDARAYARMLRLCYFAVKRSDPGAEVVFGPIHRNDMGFLRATYQALRAYPDAAANDDFFDVLSVHPYADDRAPEDTDPRFVTESLDRNFSGLPKMKRVLEEHGDGHKRIVVTEMAWPVSDLPFAKGVGLELQAAYLDRAYRMAQRWPWLDVMLWYGFKSHDPIEEPFSMVETDLEPRPAFEAFRRAATGLDALPSAER